MGCWGAPMQMKVNLFLGFSQRLSKPLFNDKWVWFYWINTLHVVALWSIVLVVRKTTLDHNCRQINLMWSFYYHFSGLTQIVQVTFRRYTALIQPGNVQSYSHWSLNSFHTVTDTVIAACACDGLLNTAPRGSCQIWAACLVMDLVFAGARSVALTTDYEVTLLYLQESH